MAIIPEFQQQRLASSVVGTPGVDPSAGAVAGRIAGLAGKAADISFKIATQRDDALAAAEANRRAVEFDIKLEELRETTKAEFQDNPRQGQIEFNNRSLELFNSSLGESQNGKANRLFSVAGQASIGREKKGFATYRLNQEVVLAKNNLVDANNLLALKANAIGKADHSPDGLQQTFDLIDRSELALGASKIVLGAEESQKLAKLGPKSILTGYLEGVIETNPEFALKVLDNPTVVDTFDSFDEIVSLQNKALAQVDALDRKAEKQLTQQQAKNHFSNTMRINKDPESISDDELKRQVEAGEISGTHGIAEMKQKSTPSTRKSIESVRAEGKRLEALGELTNEWIAENAYQLSPGDVEKFADSLTTGVTSNPAYKAAVAAIDAEVDEIAFGFRTTADDKLFSDAVETVRIAVIKENKNPMTVAQEQIKLIRKQKAEQNLSKPANTRARVIKRKNGGVVTPELVTEERRKLAEKVTKNQLSKDEAEIQAEALEILEREVTNAE